MPKFGFVGIDGRPVEVPTRRCLRLVQVQNALRAARRAHATRLSCLCGGGDLEVFVVPGFAGEIFDIRRKSKNDPHVAGCPAGELGFFMTRPPVLYALGAFELPVDTHPDQTEAGNAAVGRRVRLGSFTHFAHQLFARASMRAFCRANAGKNYRDRGLRTFTVAEFHASLREVLGTAELSRGEPLVAALAGQHHEILWGVTDTAPLGQVLAEAHAKPGDVEVLLSGCHSFGSDGPLERHVRIPANVVAHAGGRRIGYDKLIAPPYWYFLVVDSRPREMRHGDVTLATRVVVFPVAATGALYAVESDFERQVVVEEHSRGFAFLKPAVHYDLDELGEAFWPFGLLECGRLPHRPDLIVYSKRRCWVVELAGLENKPGYLELVDQRLAAMVAVAAHEDVKRFQISRKKFLEEQAALANSGRN